MPVYVHGTGYFWANESNSAGQIPRLLCFFMEFIKSTHLGHTLRYLFSFMLDRIYYFSFQEVFPSEFCKCEISHKYNSPVLCKKCRWHSQQELSCEDLFQSLQQKCLKQQTYHCRILVPRCFALYCPCSTGQIFAITLERKWARVCNLQIRLCVSHLGWRPEQERTALLGCAEPEIKVSVSVGDNYIF